MPISEDTHAVALDSHAYPHLQTECAKFENLFSL